MFFSQRGLAVAARGRQTRPRPGDSGEVRRRGAGISSAGRRSGDEAERRHRVQVFGGREAMCESEGTGTRGTWLHLTPRNTVASFKDGRPKPKSSQRESTEPVRTAGSRRVQFRESGLH